MSKRSGMQAGNMQAGKMALFRAAPLGVALMALALGLPATAQDSARASKQYDSVRSSSKILDHLYAKHLYLIIACSNAG